MASKLAAALRAATRPITFRSSWSRRSISRPIKCSGSKAAPDDFLTKPVDDIALVTRVKNLARLKMLNDEMIMRASTGKQMGIPDDGSLARALSGEVGPRSAR